MRNKAFIRTYWLMIVPGYAWLVLFSIVPMFGILMAFEDYNPMYGYFRSPWVGLSNFRYMFSMADSWSIIYNTVFIATMKVVLNLIFPLIFALLLNELRLARYKRLVQTVTYMPYFLSWVVVGGILTTMLSPGTGVVNRVIQALGGEPIYFMASVPYFRGVLVVSDIWKEIGWSSIIYLAALSGVDGQLYEAATVDGANKFRQLLAITLPSIAPTIITLFILRVGNILNAGMDQIYAMYSPPVYSVSDILDTLSLRIGIKNMQYSMSTATSIFKSIIGLAMILISNRLCKFIDEDSGIF